MRILSTGYTFNAAGKTITFTGSIPPSLESILQVTNVTTGTLMFQPQAGAAFSGTWSSPTLTLACDTTGMANSDRLLILFEDGQPQSITANRIAVTGTASIATSNTDIITGTVSGWYDALGFNYATVVLTGGAGISAGQITFEWTNNTSTTPNGFAALYQTNSLSAAWASAAVSVSANSNTPYFIPLPGRFFRARVSTPFAGGTVQATVTLSNVAPVLTAQNVVVGTSNLGINVSQIGANSTIIGQANGSGGRSLGVGLVSAIANVDVSAGNWAAASGTLATVADNSGGGASTGFFVDVTAYSAGSSTGLDIFLQESLNSGTTWRDIWQVEAFTATGNAVIPPLPINGRRRFRWVNRTAAATTATVTITAMHTSASCPRQVQFFDRTAGVGSGTATLSTATPAYDVAGTIPTVVVDAGTAGAVASFQVEMSLTGAANSWYAASAATAISSTSANRTVIPLTAGVRGRFLRVVVTAAGTSQLVNNVAIYGMQA